MKPKPIGIIGGAGPLAGSFLLDRVLRLCTDLYGCYLDEDFPEVYFLNFPFSKMLSSDKDENLLQKELSFCLAKVRQNGAEVLAIACNTLHAFLDTPCKDLIYLPQVIVNQLSERQMPLVLATTTSKEAKVHQGFFPCCYPDGNVQQQIDALIDLILKGKNPDEKIQELLVYLEKEEVDTFILGCTELSLFSEKFILKNKTFVDPLEILANKIVETSFNNLRRPICP